MANAIVPAAIPTLTIGGRVFTDLANLKTLVGYCAGAGGTNTDFRTMAGAVYVVPASKSFRILAVKFMIATAGTCLFGYCDNDVGVGSATAPTNGAYMINSSGQMLVTPIANTNIAVEFPFDLIVPTGKYPFASGGGGTFNGTVIIYGYEV